ncbi:hypothetical protein FGO68_gene3869 [Halteria grandinella]|uniref:Uncharacterized protein n=1 Tax=Halteria grandinella TaxID=5974 RepID=A0A8J8T0A6_HALGN|nr:hypothetical protein FGO68_gene3869 [Halteria grandinella]
MLYIIQNLFKLCLAYTFYYFTFSFIYLPKSLHLQYMAIIQALFSLEYGYMSDILSFCLPPEIFNNSCFITVCQPCQLYLVVGIFFYQLFAKLGKLQLSKFEFMVVMPKSRTQFRIFRIAAVKKFRFFSIFKQMLEFRDNNSHVRVFTFHLNWDWLEVFIEFFVGCCQDEEIRGKIPKNVLKHLLMLVQFYMFKHLNHSNYSPFPIKNFVLQSLMSLRNVAFKQEYFIIEDVKAFLTIRFPKYIIKGSEWITYKFFFKYQACALLN